MQPVAAPEPQPEETQAVESELEVTYEPEPEQQQEAEPASEPSDSLEGELVATDAARQLASEHGIDLAAVTGTGAEGRITKDDVAALLPESN